MDLKNSFVNGHFIGQFVILNTLNLSLFFSTVWKNKYERVWKEMSRALSYWSRVHLWNKNSIPSADSIIPKSNEPTGHCCKSWVKKYNQTSEKTMCYLQLCKITKKPEYYQRLEQNSFLDLWIFAIFVLWADSDDLLHAEYITHYFIAFKVLNPEGGVRGDKWAGQNSDFCQTELMTRNGILFCWLNL